MLRCLIFATGFIALLLPGVATPPSPSAPLTDFPTEAQTQQLPGRYRRLAQPAHRDLSPEGRALVRPNQERGIRVPW
jgi:hypothetical protein